MTDVSFRPDRRTIMGIGAFLTAAGGYSCRVAAQPPARADAAAAWRAAPARPLWPQAMPGSGFVSSRAPGGGSPVFIRNVARPELRIFYPARANGRSLLVMPGGAYSFISIANEGVDIAAKLTARGYTVFVLIYRLPGEGWSDRSDVPLQDAQRAMRVVRDDAARNGLDPAMVDALGFSAGGHLAASLATGFEEHLHKPVDAIDGLDPRPRSVGLIYPVISHERGIGHAESSARLLGAHPGPALVERRSPVLHVGAATPAAFFVHALDDSAVPVENSLMMMRAMQAAGRPVEAHLFERGGHGFGAGRPGSPAAGWLDLYAAWLAAPRD